MIISHARHFAGVGRIALAFFRNGSDSAQVDLTHRAARKFVIYIYSALVKLIFFLVQVEPRLLVSCAQWNIVSVVEGSHILT